MPYEPPSWQGLTEEQKRARVARFAGDPDDLVVIRLDDEARREVAEEGRQALKAQD